MEAERNRRKQLLDTQAQINVAEGQKQRVILESEGHVSHFLNLRLFVKPSPFLYSLKPNRMRPMRNTKR